ncbi:hypothetical protein VPH35_015349 [Triticum aestivum]|uniref:Uncharacterized protein n=1 Tax=Aegilops tauschii TaxID=37682 RepID=M8BFU1_AEGTA
MEWRRGNSRKPRQKRHEAGSQVRLATWAHNHQRSMKMQPFNDTRGDEVAREPPTSRVTAEIQQLLEAKNSRGGRRAGHLGEATPARTDGCRAARRLRTAGTAPHNDRGG